MAPPAPGHVLLLCVCVALALGTRGCAWPSGSGAHMCLPMPPAPPASHSRSAPSALPIFPPFLKRFFLRGGAGAARAWCRFCLGRTVERRRVPAGGPAVVLLRSWRRWYNWRIVCAALTLLYQTRISLIIFQALNSPTNTQQPPRNPPLPPHNTQPPPLMYVILRHHFIITYISWLTRKHPRLSRSA